MEPVTLAVTALSLVATKATEKLGEHFGEGVIASAKHLLEVLRRRAPETVRRLELTGVARDSDVIDVEILEEVKRVAAAEPAVQTAMAATLAAVTAEQASSKLADTIEVVQMGKGDNFAGDNIARDKIDTQIITHNH